MYQYDEETEFYYLKSRYYNPDLGRFITRDGIDSINLYSYAGNNPVNFVDPNGQLLSFLIVYLSTLGMAPDTNFDLMSLADSTTAFSQNPSIGNGLAVVLDGGALLLPGVPAGGGKVSKKIAKWTGNTFKWLNKGKADNFVYYGIKNGKAVYTGITKQDLAKRLYQHNYSGKGFETLEEVVSGLTRNQARAVEQYLIENGFASALNKINSISPSSSYYDDAMEWAEIFLNSLK